MPFFLLKDTERNRKVCSRGDCGPFYLFSDMFFSQHFCLKTFQSHLNHLYRLYFNSWAQLSKPLPRGTCDGSDRQCDMDEAQPTLLPHSCGRGSHLSYTCPYSLSQGTGKQCHSSLNTCFELVTHEALGCSNLISVLSWVSFIMSLMVTDQLTGRVLH